MDAKSKLKLKWLVLFYFSYILFAMPYSMFNGIWPIISKDLNVMETQLGILSSFFLFFQTVFLSISSYIIFKFGSRITTSIGITLIAISLLVFSKISSFAMCIVGITLLACGSGIVNTTSSFFLAVHYDAKSMGGLHATWGLGSTLGPLIMTQLLLRGFTYKQGFLVIFPFYLAYAIYMIISKTKDSKHHFENKEKETLIEKEKNRINIKEIFTDKNVILFFACMFLAEFLHSGTSVWYSTYLVVQHNIDRIIAANILSAYFVGLTISRALSGFIADKIGSRKVIMYGFTFYTISTIVLVINVSSLPILAIIGVLLGICIAPGYPLLMSLTKETFNNDLLEGIVGVAGSVGQFGGFMATIFISNFTSIFSMRWFSYVIFAFGIISIFIVKKFNNIHK